MDLQIIWSATFSHTSSSFAVSDILPCLSFFGFWIFTLITFVSIREVFVFHLHFNGGKLWQTLTTVSQNGRASSGPRHFIEPPGVPAARSSVFQMTSLAQEPRGPWGPRPHAPGHAALTPGLLGLVGQWPVERWELRTSPRVEGFQVVSHRSWSFWLQPDGPTFRKKKKKNIAFTQKNTNEIELRTGGALFPVQSLWMSICTLAK